MAGTTIPVTTTARQEPPEQPTQVSANAEGLVFTNNGKTILEIEASGGASNITFSPLSLVDSQAVEDWVVELESGDVVIIGPFPPTIYNNASNQVVIATSTTNAKARAYSVGS